MGLPRKAVSDGDQGSSPQRMQETGKRGRERCRETALEHRVAELEAELRARDDFLAIAAHELRNPMTPIAGRVELLLNLAHREPDRIPVEMINGLERLQYLVDAYIRRATTFLDISRISSQSLQLSFANVNLSSLVRNSVLAMSPVAESAGCQVSLDVQDGVTGTLDQTAVEQIVENILSNAIRYGAGHPIQVELASDLSTACLRVRDRGIGISEVEQARIFGRFQRATGNNTEGGFGVGLWITKQLVLAMGGDISVTSEVGIGSIFTVSLPLKGS